jgi:hypothetical protein
MRGLIVCAVALALTGCSDESDAIGVAEAAVKQTLADPYSARFEQVRYLPGSEKWQSNVCGFVNARSVAGGYFGPQPFVVKVIGNKGFAKVLKPGEWFTYRDDFSVCGIVSDPFR